MNRLRLSTMRVCAAVVMCAAAGILWGAEAIAPPDAEKTDARPEAPKLDKIRLDLEAKRIEIHGRFCLDEGILDFLAVTMGGQEYESVTAIDCAGSRLHAALLALGATPGPSPEMMELLKKNPPKDRPLPKQIGTQLNVHVEWLADGKKVSVSAHELLINRKLGKVQPEGLWTFTGSHFAKDLDGKEFYMADIDRTLLAVVYLGSAVVNFNYDAGNPYAAEDEGYAANTKLAPKKDTPVTIVITLAKKKD